MADITQLPGNLNISTTIHDDFSFLLDFSIVLTGYTFSAKIVSNTGTETALTVTATDLSTGQITLSTTDVVLTAIGAGQHSWYLQWIAPTAIDRRVLSGSFILQA